MHTFLGISEQVSTVDLNEEAIDTNGASDRFAGTYLYAVTPGFSPQEAGNFAMRAAAKVGTHFGPRLEPASYKGLLPVK